MSISCVPSAIRILTVAVTCALVSSARAAAQTGDAPDEDALNLNVMIEGVLEGESTGGVGIVFGLDADRVFIVTPNHVVRRGTSDATNIRVLFRNRRQAPVEARLAPESDPSLDLAVLIVDAARKRGLAICDFAMDRLGDPDSLTRGDGVYPVGFPNGVRWAVPVTADRFVELRGDVLTFQSLFIARGYSGGALFAEDGTVVGVIQKDQPPFGSAVHIRTVIDVLRRWKYPVGLHEADAAHHAARKGDVEQLRRLLSGGGCSVAQRRDDDKGWTPLFWAAASGQPGAVTVLLEHGANANETSDFGDTPLHIAASFERSRRVLLRMDHAPSTPAAYAEVVERLLAAGANVNRPNNDGTTPLDEAAGSSAELVTRLLKAGASINRRSAFGPLSEAVSSQRADTLSLLLASGADANAKGPEQKTLLHQALDWSRRSPLEWKPAETVEMVRVLLKAGADPNFSTEDDPPAVFGLLEPIDNQIRRWGQSYPALDMFIEKHVVEVVRLLLSAGAKPNGNWTDRRGDRRLPLGPVVGDGHFRRDSPWDVTRVELGRMLLAAGADPRRQEIGPITTFAVRTGDSALLKAVLARGVDVNWAAWSDDRPLLVAVTGRNVDAARQLLDAGADVNTRDVFGHSVLSKAKGNDDAAMVKLLLARGARD